MSIGAALTHKTSETIHYSNYEGDDDDTRKMINKYVDYLNQKEIKKENRKEYAGCILMLIGLILILFIAYMNIN